MPYRELFRIIKGKSVLLEEYARQKIYAEEPYASEADKMMRQPGKTAAVAL